MTILADELFAQAEPERAEAWLVLAIRADNTWALRTLLERHAGELERCERIAYFLELAAACQADELYALAERYDAAGHAAEVDRHFLDRAEAGDIHAQAAYAERLWRADQRDRSESWWRRAIEGGANYALHRLADALSVAEPSRLAGPGQPTPARRRAGRSSVSGRSKVVALHCQGVACTARPRHAEHVAHPLARDGIRKCTE